MYIAPQIILKLQNVYVLEIFIILQDIVWYNTYFVDILQLFKDWCAIFCGTKPISEVLYLFDAS